MEMRNIIDIVAELNNRLNKPDSEYNNCKKYLKVIEYLLNHNIDMDRQLCQALNDNEDLEYDNEELDKEILDLKTIISVLENEVSRLKKELSTVFV